MSIYTDQPFSENEERYFLAEILKRSNLSTITLMNLIQEHRVKPAWTEIALPNGRSVASCQYAWSNLEARTQQQQQQQQQQQHQQQQFPQHLQAHQQQQQQQHQLIADIQHQRPPKRPHSMIDITSPINRELQPRPTTTYSGGFSGQQTSPIPVETQKKKRGRPTKAEHQIRSAEAAAKGETWPKPRNKTKGSRTSSSAAIESLPGHGTGSMDESGEEAGSIEAGRSTTKMSGNALINVMNPPGIQTKGGNLQDIVIQPAGQAHDEEGEEEGGGEANSTRSESGLSQFPQQPLMPRISAPPHLQSFGPQLGHPYNPGG